MVRSLVARVGLPGGRSAPASPGAARLSSFCLCRNHRVDDVVHHLDIGVSMGNAPGHDGEFYQGGAGLSGNERGHLFRELRLRTTISTWSAFISFTISSMWRGVGS